MTFELGSWVWWMGISLIYPVPGETPVCTRPVGRDRFWWAHRQERWLSSRSSVLPVWASKGYFYLRPSKLTAEGAGRGWSWWPADTTLPGRLRLCPLQSQHGVSIPSHPLKYSPQINPTNCKGTFSYVSDQQLRKSNSESISNLFRGRPSRKERENSKIGDRVLVSADTFRGRRLTWERITGEGWNTHMWAWHLFCSLIF